MPFIANYDNSSGYHICETDADGVGKPARLHILSSGHEEDIKLTETVSRLVLMALRLPGGPDHAIGILRAEIIKCREST
jgi:hypothetical protein